MQILLSIPAPVIGLVGGGIITALAFVTASINTANENA